MLQTCLQHVAHREASSPRSWCRLCTQIHRVGHRLAFPAIRSFFARESLRPRLKFYKLVCIVVSLRYLLCTLWYTFRTHFVYSRQFPPHPASPFLLSPDSYFNFKRFRFFPQSEPKPSSPTFCFFFIPTTKAATFRNRRA